MLGEVRTADDRTGVPERHASIRRRVWPHLLLCCAGLLALVGMAILSIGVGSGAMSFGTAWHLLWSPQEGYDTAVVQSMRLPRTVLGIVCGAALAVAGALMQTLTRNPLADPGIFGINAGAAASIVVAISVFGFTDLVGYVWFGFAGAAVASVTTYLLGTRSRGGSTPIRMALAGTAVAATLTAFTNGFVYLDSASFAQYRSWIVGSLNVQSSAAVWQVLPFLLAALLLALALARSLNLLSLGEEMSTALGSRVARTRALGMVAIVVLCGATTAAAGPIAFVGLAIPHLVRAFTGPNHRLLLPYCMLISPLLLLGADILGRVIGPGGELQVAIMTALLGGPVFVAIARLRRLPEL